MWFAKAGVTGINAIARANFSDHGLTLQAAVAGQGVALGSNVLADEDLASARLVCPFELVMPTMDDYYLVTTKRALARPRVKEFVAWITHEAKSLG